MSHVHVRLPKLKELKERLKDEEWIKYYTKFGAYSGSSESIDYLIQKTNEYYERKTD